MYVATDLHGHTLYSDARNTPAELVRRRHASGLEVVAISDHDLFAGVRGGAAVANDLGMILVPAAECTSMLHFGTEEVEQLHVLAYFPPSYLEDDRLERTFMYQRGLKIQTRWRQFVLAWFDALDPADKDAIDRHRSWRFTSSASFPGLQMIIDRITLRRPDLFPAFRKHHVRFWTEDRELFGWSPEELIDAIRADGGFDVVAHAVRYKDKARLEQVLEYASGVEVYTSRHNERVAARFRAWAEERNKHWTASSDDHQQREYERPASGTPIRTIERILQGAMPLRARTASAAHA